MERSEDEQPATQDDSSSLDSEEAGQVAKKIIKVKRLSWRSDRFTKILDSLDRKHLQVNDEGADFLTNNHSRGSRKHPGWRTLTALKAKQPKEMLLALFLFL